MRLRDSEQWANARIRKAGDILETVKRRCAVQADYCGCADDSQHLCNLQSVHVLNNLQIKGHWKQRLFVWKLFHKKGRWLDETA